MLVSSALAYGLQRTSAAATLGTACALIVTLVLGVLFTHLAHVSGFTSEDAAFLQAPSLHISLRGLILAGIVIGALGVLEDLTVTQSSSVMVLRRADPTHKAREAQPHAIEVGHDHISVSIVTLVFAYVGSSLPTLPTSSIGSPPFSRTVNEEIIADQVIATLVGAIGLIAAVPLTTGLAVLPASRMPVGAIPAYSNTRTPEV